MYKNKNIKSNNAGRPASSRRGILVAAIAVVALLVVAGAAFAYHRHHTQVANAKTQSKTADAQTINNAPATPQEQQSSDDNKTRIVDQQNGSTTPSSGTKRATPTITHSDASGAQVEVDSFVSGVVEDGGTCTLTATNGSATVTRTTTGVANATTTLCPNFSIDKAAFNPTGTWNIVISYASSAASGSSSVTPLVVN